MYKAIQYLPKLDNVRAMNNQFPVLVFFVQNWKHDGFGSISENSGFVMVISLFFLLPKAALSKNLLWKVWEIALGSNLSVYFTKENDEKKKSEQTNKPK